MEEGVDRRSGGGGGAGGLRTSFGSTSGGGASNESKARIALAHHYTVTVGAGGTGQQRTPFKGSNGTNSVFHYNINRGGGGWTWNSLGKMVVQGWWRITSSWWKRVLLNQGFDGGMVMAGAH